MSEVIHLCVNNFYSSSRDTPTHSDVDLGAVAKVTQGFSGAQLDKVSYSTCYPCLACHLVADVNSARCAEKLH